MIRTLRFIRYLDSSCWFYRPKEEVEARLKVVIASEKKSKTESLDLLQDDEEAKPSLEVTDKEDEVLPSSEDQGGLGLEAEKDPQRSSSARPA